MMLLVATSCLFLSSCGGDDDKDEPKNPEQEWKSLVGIWYNSRSYGGITWEFCEDGTCSRFTGSPSVVYLEGTWTYDQKNKILVAITNGGRNEDSWRVISITENSWTGELLTGQGATLTYVRMDGDE